MRIRLGNRTNAQSDPVPLNAVPLRVGNSPTRITAIGFDLATQLDSPAAGITSMEILRLLNLVVLTAGPKQRNRNIYRVRNGARMRDWYVLHQGKLASPDPASIGASLANQVRRASVVIPCRGDSKKLRFPKDTDIPTWALHGGKIDISWGTVGGTEGLPAGSTIDSASVEVWAEYEVDNSGDNTVATPWEVNFLDTAVNTPELPSNDLLYASVLNHDRDHSDNTTIHIPGVADNMTYQTLAGAWNHQAHDADAMLSLTAPEQLPLVYPQDYSKTTDAIDDLPPLSVTRGSSDSQIYQYQILLDAEAFAEEGAEAAGTTLAEAEAAGRVSRKFGSKNGDRVRVRDPRRAAKFARVLPIKIGQAR